MVKRLTKFQFQSFPHASRPDNYEDIYEEHEWYSDDSESTLGLLIQDRIDGDWAYVVMQVEGESVFTLVWGDISIEDRESAREQLLIEIDRCSTDLGKERPSNDNTNLIRRIGDPDPFTPVVVPSRLNSSFDLVRNEGRFAPARDMVREAFSSYVDRDGNFLEQFQTTGFDSRIWELYLHTFLVDAGFNYLPSVSPDFVVSKGERELALRL